MSFTLFAGRSIMGRAAIAALCGLMLCEGLAIAAPAPVSPAAPQKPVLRSSKPAATGNPHLHLPTSSAKTSSAKPAAKKTTVKKVAGKTVKTVHVRRLHLTAVQHLAGNISGKVVNAKGAPVAGATVVLKRPGGRRLASARARHSTSTNLAGVYNMYLVHPGRYRVAAIKKGAGRGHAPVSMQTGGSHHINLKLAGAAAPKRKHK